MWTREMLKTKAKEVLKGSYWKAFLVSIVIALVGGGDGQSSNFNWNLNERRGGTNFFTHTNEGWLTSLFIASITIAVIVVLFAIVLRIFIGYALEVGGRHYFIQSAQYNINLNYLGYAFERTRYFDIIKAMLWRTFMNFLWYLLLIIPGIIKSYAYRMVPYILADNPNIGYKRALELSERMTDGEKLDIFVLDLSFIGWYLLGMMAFFIGVIFVFPYQNATEAELYIVLRSNAIENGMCSYEELLLEHNV